MDGALRSFLMLSALAHAAGLSLFGVTFDGRHSAGTPQPPVAVYGSAAYFSARPAGQQCARGPAAGGTVRGLLCPVRGFGGPRPESRKPQVIPDASGGKRFFSYPAAPADFSRKRDSVVTIHPLLPFQLQMYFQDRQSVHLELMFKIIVSGKRRQVLVRRKISSGNLDADLLCARYLGHYLFIEQARFVPNTWQTVRIDLSR